MSTANGVTDPQTLFEQSPFPARDTTEMGEGMAFATLYSITRTETFIPAYWSRHRDVKLAQFSRLSDHLKIAINTFISKASTVPLRISPRDRSVQSHVDLAESIYNALMVNSGFMNGFYTEYQKFLYDYLTQDNGAFALVLGPGLATGPIVGRASGIVHLASYRCTRTKDPLYPVVYLHTDGKRYKIFYTRIISMVNLPAPDPDLNGIGQCPVGLCVDAAKELYDITLFVQEKLGSRPQRQILYAKTGATIDQLLGAVSHAENQLTNQGLSRFAKTLFLAPKLAGSKLELDQIDLASVPDGFNRQSDTLISLAIIAAAFGLDLRDLAFSFGVQGQTRSDADIQHLKGMGKGVAEVTAEFAKQLCDRFLPPSLVASFDYMDDSQDLKTATVSAQRSTARTRDIMGGVLNPRVSRQHMLRTGELTESEFEELELSDGRMVDGTNVLALFYSPDPVYKEVLDLSISEPLDVAANEPEMVLKAIGKQERVAWEMLADTGGERNRRKIRYALAALENLKKLYEEKQQEELMQEQQEEMAKANKPNALPQAKSGRVGADKAAVAPNAGRSKKNGANG